jgi:hypothetical protein
VTLNNLTLLAGLTLAGTTIAKQNLKGGPHPSYLRTVIASLAAAFFIALVGVAAEDVARALAWLVIVGALTVNGSALFTYLGKLGK